MNGEHVTWGLAPSAAGQGGPIIDAFPSLQVSPDSTLALIRARKRGERNIKSHWLEC